MSIWENERKYVLSIETNENLIAEIAGKILKIEQGYLGNARIRKSVNHKEKYYITFKQNFRDKIIEIEDRISEEDYEELATEASSWTRKTRYYIGGWEVDFFKYNAKNYFIMAEIELPDGVNEPYGIPSFITTNLTFVVPRNDSSFSSKKLSDPTYAQKMLETIEKRSCS